MNTVREFLEGINYPSVAKRSVLLLLPALLMPLGVACYYACMLGADPFSIFVDGEHVLLGLTYGQITTINNIVLLALMLIFGRKYVNVGTVITSFTTGPLIDLFRGLIVDYIRPQDSGYIVQGAVLIAGCTLFAVGVGMYIAIDLGIGAVDFISLFLRDKLHVKLKFIRISVDGICVIAGYLMGGTIGIGTVLGVLATGPIVEFTLSHIKKPVEDFAGPVRKITMEGAPENGF